MKICCIQLEILLNLFVWRSTLNCWYSIPLSWFCLDLERLRSVNSLVARDLIVIKLLTNWYLIISIVEVNNTIFPSIVKRQKKEKKKKKNSRGEDKHRGHCKHVDQNRRRWKSIYTYLITQTVDIEDIYLCYFVLSVQHYLVLIVF